MVAENFTKNTANMKELESASEPAGAQTEKKEIERDGSLGRAGTNSLY